MSNLIEQLGGYEKARELIRYAPEGANFLETYPLGPRFYVFDIGCNRAINIHELRKELLEHRRAHNIYEVGDKAVYIPTGELVTVAEQEFSMNYIFIDFPDGDFIDCLYSEVRHVELEVLNDIDIPPNTIILGDK